MQVWKSYLAASAQAVGKVWHKAVALLRTLIGRGLLAINTAHDRVCQPGSILKDAQ